jgi:putative hydrolase of the HAD superfamily
MTKIRWIFFDCFNTLIDDFDDEGKITGLGPIEKIPVQKGWFSSIQAFREAYDRGRASLWGKKNGECSLDQRLTYTLSKQTQQSKSAIDDLVELMMSVNAVEYPKTVRPTPGVCSMLEAWQGRFRFGVVSNFYMAHWPEQLLSDFKLRQYFDFVIDSTAENCRKPDTAIYRRALERAKASADEVLFIGDDHLNDVLKPRELGMQALHRCRHNQRPAVIKSPEVYPINDWEDFRPSSYNFSS